MLTKSFLIAFCLLGLAARFSPGQEEKKRNVPPIFELKEVTPAAEIFRLTSAEKPLILTDAEMARKFFDGDAMAKISRQMSFERQVLMVFAWRGSGQDQLDFTVLESFPEQIKFNYMPGRTRDLREHTKVYVVRANVRWKGKPVRPDSKTSDEDYIQVEVRGKLNSQVFAIGAETTGVQISAQGVTWELDFGDNKKFRELAKELDGQKVLVTGKLSAKKGVEISRRMIVAVETFHAAGETPDER